MDISCRETDALEGNVKKVLVTGGAGFIGSHACKSLARSGFLPVVYDNLCRGHAAAVKWGPLEVGDIADTTRLHEVLGKYQPAAVMHFAAFAYVGESVERPLLYYSNNVGGTAALLRAIIDYGNLPLVFSSTCATYGMPEKIPITDHPQRPINPYGFTKLVVERLLSNCSAAHQLRWVSLRYFNAAGSDPDGEIGEVHDPETHLIPLVVKSAQTGTPVRIYGADYNTPDGTCVRDFIHVMDIADAHIRSLNYLLDGGESCALNLANARGYSVREVISTAERVCGRTILTTTAPRRVGDPPALVGSAEQAKALLGWKPLRSELQVQIRDTWNWFNSGRGFSQI